MFKKQARTLSVVQRLADALATFAAWMTAFIIRFIILKGGQTGFFDEFLLLSILLIVLVLIYSTRNHLYESTRYFPWYREILQVIKSQLQATVTFVVILYFAWPMRLSRFSILLYLGLGLLYALIMRGLVRSVLNRARRKGKNLRHVLIIGRGDSLKDYLQLLTETPEKGIRIISWVDSDGAAADFGIIETKLEELTLEGPDAPDAVIIGYNDGSQDHLNKILSIFNKTFIRIFIVPDVENVFIGYTIEEFHGVPLMTVNSTNITMINAVIKRVIDIIGASIGMLLLSPLYLIIGVLVKATSRGPVFYSQERMTLEGKLFKMYKFRSMRTDAETDGAQWASPDDDRRTPIGAFLRSTSIDEFPQLWNVFKGDMSLVGPRPERPVFIDKFKDEIPSYMLRHRMKTGLTGWAQVNGWRGDTSLEKRIEFDLYYIRNWSLFLDLKIVLLTVIKGFINDNAY